MVLLLTRRTTYVLALSIGLRSLRRDLAPLLSFPATWLLAFVSTFLFFFFLLLFPLLHCGVGPHFAAVICELAKQPRRPADRTELSPSERGPNLLSNDETRRAPRLAPVTRFHTGAARGFGSLRACALAPALLPADFPSWSERIAKPDH